MASIVTAVLKATVGLLVNKGRDFAADKLKEGDVTEEQFRNMIVREIDDIKSKLDGLARKDLLTSISFFKEGIVFLYKVLDTKSSGGAGTATEQGAVTQGAREKTIQHSLRTLAAGVEKVSLAKGMETLDGSGKRALADAKKRFDDARMKATEAFNNVALSTSDRILAMQYRVMSSILEKIDNPKEAIAACRLCLEELHSMPAVQRSFNVEETGGFLSLFNKSEREEIIQSVRDINRVIFIVTEVADGVLSTEFDTWPCVNIGGKDVNPLKQQGESTFDSRVLPWSFGQEGEEKHKLSHPQSITSNTQGQFIVAENDSIKVFDCDGNFVQCLTISDELLKLTEDTIRVQDVATDHKDNVYVLASVLLSRIQVFDKHGNNCRHFDLGAIFEGKLVAVNRNENVIVLGSESLFSVTTVVKVYDLDGRVVNNFEFEQNPLQFSNIASANDAQIMIMKNRFMTESKVLVFDSQGNHLRDFSMPYSRTVMAFYLPTEKVLIADAGYPNQITLRVYTKDGRIVRSIILTTDNIHSLSGLAATTEGRVAVLCTTKETGNESKKHVVLVV